VSVSAVQGQEFSGTVATFLDTDPGGLARDYLATIKWGDGTTSTGTILLDPSGNGFDVVASHVYNQSGQFTTTITIQSDNGAGARLRSTITVSPTTQPEIKTTILQVDAKLSSGPSSKRSYRN
jgi:hypothetical protein